MRMKQRKGNCQNQLLTPYLIFVESKNSGIAMSYLDKFKHQPNSYKNKIHVVSFSGGRTSAYLVHLMEKKRKLEGWDVRYVYCDTGMEHGLTLRFIREVVKFWDVDLKILQLKITPELGKPNSYTEWTPADIQTRMPAIKPFADMLEKYGTPYLGGAFCTDRLKLAPFKSYCDENFGEDNYITWLGMREDEPERLNAKYGIRYLAELSEFTKQDVLDWWSNQPFDLLIDEHLGNCTFCIKKSTLKVALATKDEPGLSNLWIYLINSKKTRVVASRFTKSEVMYRGYLSLEGISLMYADKSRKMIARRISSQKSYDTGSCSESCEAILV